MKIAEFNELCHREFGSDGGVVTMVHLTPASRHELANEMLRESPAAALLLFGDSSSDARVAPIPAGATAGHMVNPASGTRVIVAGAEGDADAAEVMRYVAISGDAPALPLPPLPAAGDAEPRSVAYPVI